MPRTELLPVPLTQSELNERAAEMATLVVDIDKAEQRAKDARAMAKAALDEQRARLRDLAAEVYSGQAQREVEIEDRPNFEEGLVHTCRRDTGEIIRSRDMTANDRQLHLRGVATVIEFGGGRPPSRTAVDIEGVPPGPQARADADQHASADADDDASMRARARALMAEGHGMVPPADADFLQTGDEDAF